METAALIYGTAWKKERTAELVRTAYAAGFRAFDTANQPRHYQEPLVGEALADFLQSRTNLFIQTKFTPPGGQDSRRPYDPQAAIKTQVQQSFHSSLQNLGVEYLDSYLLHGPYSYPALGAEDWEAWEALTELYRSGGARAIGISNITLGQLTALTEQADVPPMVVQNRCYASRGWDERVRQYCRANGISYQGFSLLTANPQVFTHPETAKIAARHGLTPAQLLYRFAIEIGIVPLTGTTDTVHMSEALAVIETELTEAEVQKILSLN
jgi:diketogulonate reductase-like aldo/keto reductase